VESCNIGRHLKPPHQILPRLRHVVLSGAVAVRAEVLRLHRLALTAAKVLELVRDEAALKGVDDEGFD
jgi:hypothetical protein